MDATLKTAAYARPTPATAGTQGKIGRYAASFGISLALTSLFNAALVVVKELNEATVLEAMKRATGHHWITHGVLDIVLFLVLGFALAGWAGRFANRQQAVLAAIGAGVLLGALTIAAFYLFH